jgi:hypothetical protein
MGVIPEERSLCRCGSRKVWSTHAIGNPKESDRNAEHAHAADRFAREIEGFLTGIPSARGG